MSIINDIHFKSKNLLQRLRGLKFIVDENRDVLNKNSVSLEFLAFKIDIAQNFIDELHLWEELGNQSKCDDVSVHAQFFLEQAQVLMDRLLDEQCEEAWLVFQRELSITSYASTSYKFVLSTSKKDCSSSIAV